MHEHLKKHRKRYLIILLLVILTAILWHMLYLQGEEPRRQQEKSWIVATIRATLGDYAPQLVLYGRTESPEQSTIKSALTADINTILVREGDVVKKGQTLLTLDDREVKLLRVQRQSEVNDISAQIKAEIERSKADEQSYQHELELLKLSKRAHRREETLVKRRVGTRANLDAAKEVVTTRSLAVTTRKYSLADHHNRLARLNSQKKRALSLLEHANLDLERTTVRSPYSGRITKIHVATGNRVQNGESLLELFNTDELEVRAQLPERYVAIIRQALQQKALISGYAIAEGERRLLTLVRLAGLIESGHGGVDAFLRVTNRPSSHTLGRSLEIILTLPQLNRVYKIPNRAIYADSRIYIVKSGRMHAVKVTRVGDLYSNQASSQILITSAKLKPGDRIVTTQLPNARTGLKIKTRQDEP